TVLACPSLYPLSLHDALPIYGVVGRDGEVAEQVQHVAAPNRVARDHGDHRLGQVLDGALQVEGVEARHALLIYVATLAAHTLVRSEEHTSELQSPYDLVCRLL